MSRFIDADRFIRIFCDECGNPYIMNISIEECRKNGCCVTRSLAEAETVEAVPVVRCKDCKHGEPVYDLIGLAQNDLVYCKSLRCAKNIDWFCADGERK